ncbi:MAG: rod shape-determining protein MreD [Pseudomonadota bacterium]|nr:rod shape-determining protein MreD [Pseudomonadota bacterium]
MRPALGYAERAGKGLAPAALTVLLVLISALPFPLAALEDIMPFWGLMAVFYWAVFRPDLLPVWAVFLAGLLEDALSGSLFGLHALVFTGSYWIALSQRRLFTAGSFFMLWTGFGIVTTGSALLVWAITSLARGVVFPPGIIVAKTMTTVAVFPLLAQGLIRVQRSLARDEDP